jgi:beta-phosphoglucomutase-like phosphatase (HAD superfamily)
MTLRALIFDVDGTMVDTEELHRQAFLAAFYKFDLRWNWGPHTYMELLKVSGGKERIAAYIDSRNEPADEKDRLKRLVPSFHRIKTRIYRELVASGAAPLRPGVLRLINEAHAAGVRLAVVATTQTANVNALLSVRLGGEAFGWIEALVGGDQVQVRQRKPDPETYDRALAALAVPGRNCMAFEDSANGLRAAQAAGLFTAVTPTRWTMAQDFTGADLLLPSLGDPGEAEDPVTERLIGAPYLSLAKIEALHAAWQAGAKAARGAE